MTEARPPHGALALFGLFGGGNLGNEASLGTALAEIHARSPGMRCVLISDPPDAEAALTGFDACLPHDALPVPRALWSLLPSRLQPPVRAALQWLTEPLRYWRTRRQVRTFDRLLVPGTGIADDYGVEPLDVPHHIARWCRAARDAGVPVWFLSIGAGPVSHPLSRRFFREALASASYRSYREQSSHDFARELGIEVSGDPVLPDLVFGPEPTDTRAPQWPPRVIGLGVMGYFGWHATHEEGQAIYATYLDKLVRLATALLRADYELRLLIGNRGGDRRVVRDLTARVAAAAPELSSRLLAPVINSYHDVLTQAAASDLVIATRFHNVLKALRLGRPVISIGYASKNDNLMRAMGLGQYCHGVEDFDPERVLQQVRELAALPAPPVMMLNRQLPEYRRALSRQYDQVLPQRGAGQG